MVEYYVIVDDWLMNWLITWQRDRWPLLINWMTDFIDWLTEGIDRDWLIDWLIEWLIDWSIVIDCVID